MIKVSQKCETLDEGIKFLMSGDFYFQKLIF